MYVILESFGASPAGAQLHATLGPCFSKPARFRQRGDGGGAREGILVSFASKRRVNGEDSRAPVALFDEGSDFER